jgi:hypothetical protein
MLLPHNIENPEFASVTFSIGKSAGDPDVTVGPQHFQIG